METRNIKGKDILPGMIINRQYNVSKGIEIIIDVSGYHPRWYSFIDYNDPYSGEFRGSINRDEELELIVDDESRQNILDECSIDLFRYKFDIEDIIEKIELIKRIREE